MTIDELMDRLRKLWEDAGKPPRMLRGKRRKPVEKAYLVCYYRAGEYFEKFSHDTAVLKSSCTGEALYRDLRDKIPGSAIYTIENIVCLG